jgi:phospholipase C
MRAGRKAVGVVSALAIALASGTPALAKKPQTTDPATPIQHVVVIFQENVSFDHYFGTYPVATNTDGSPFSAVPGTPSVNGLTSPLLSNNPNAGNAGNDPYAIGPFRLSHGEASTCDQDHNYGPEEMAFDGGLMDLFPASVGVGGNSFCADQFAYGKGQGLVMGYFDGNTVTALWNYAQYFAMNDNSYGTTFGPSTPGLLNLVAGNTFPSQPSSPSYKVQGIRGSGPYASYGTLIGDLDPTGDACSKGTTVKMSPESMNVGDLLNAKNVTWGSFMGGFDLTITNSNGTTGCNRSSDASASNGGPTKDYIPHHAFLQYWASTANPDHTRPNSVYNIGTSNDGGANHEYDLHDFFDALNAGVMPAVSFVKAPAYADGHAGYSDPLLEQAFLVNTINAIENSPFWDSTAIIISYDDSDGWYDHQTGPIVNSSALSLSDTGDERVADALNGDGKCGSGTPLKDSDGTVIQGRCGYGPRLPLLVISPFAKPNFVDNTLTDQSSVLRFIEDNWSLGQIGNGSYDALAGTLNNMFDFSHPARSKSSVLILNPASGEVVNGHHS